MTNFYYIALDSRGQESTGTIKAESQNEAVNSIRRSGLYPTSIVEAARAKKEPENERSRRSIPTKNDSQFLTRGWPFLVIMGFMVLFKCCSSFDSGSSTPRKNDPFVTATDKLNKGEQLNEREAQRIHDILNYKEEHRK